MAKEDVSVVGEVGGLKTRKPARTALTPSKGERGSLGGRVEGDGGGRGGGGEGGRGAAGAGDAQRGTASASAGVRGQKRTRTRMREDMVCGAWCGWRPARSDNVSVVGV